MLQHSFPSPRGAISQESKGTTDFYTHASNLTFLYKLLTKTLVSWSKLCVPQVSRPTDKVYLHDAPVSSNPLRRQLAPAPARSHRDPAKGWLRRLDSTRCQRRRLPRDCARLRRNGTRPRLVTRTSRSLALPLGFQTPTADPRPFRHTQGSRAMSPPSSGLPARAAAKSRGCFGAASAPAWRRHRIKP